MLESSVLTALATTSIAGLSTVFGIFPVFIGAMKTKRALNLSLSFSAGIMLSTSLCELLPQGLELVAKEITKPISVCILFLAFALGISIALVISRFIPETQNGALRSSIITAACIGLHNFPEGIATFMASYNDPQLGLYVAAAIALHNIPEGVGVALPIYCADGSKKKAVLYTVLSGITEPLGALAAFGFLRPIINEVVLGCILAFVAGIMIYISAKELIPSIFKNDDAAASSALLFGISLMLLVKAI